MGNVWACSHLVVLFEDVVHLSHVLAAYGFDDVPLVVGGVEASTTTALSFTDEGRHCGSKSSANTHGKEVLAHNAHKDGWDFLTLISFCTGRKSCTHLHTEVRFLHLHHTELEMSGNLKQKSWK